MFVCLPIHFPYIILASGSVCVGRQVLRRHNTPVCVPLLNITVSNFEKWTVYAFTCRSQRTTISTWASINRKCELYNFFLHEFPS